MLVSTHVAFRIRVLYFIQFPELFGRNYCIADNCNFQANSLCFFFLNASYSLILIPFSFVFYKLLARDFINTEANYHTDRSTVPYENLPLSGTRRSILFPRLISFVLMSSSSAT